MRRYSVETDAVLLLACTLVMAAGWGLWQLFRLFAWLALQLAVRMGTA